MKTKLLATISGITLAAMTAVATAAGPQVIDAPKGKETKVGVMVGPGEMCFRVVSAATGAPTRGHFRALIDGKPRDLDIHMGGRCLKNYGFLYNAYVIPPDEDAKVYVTGSTPVPFINYSSTFPMHQVR